MKRDDAVPFPRAEPVVRLLRAAERSTQSLRPAFPGESGQNKTLLQLSCLNAQLQKRSEGPQPFSTVSLSGVHVVDATGVSHKLSLFLFLCISFLSAARSSTEGASKMVAAFDRTPRSSQKFARSRERVPISL